MAEHKPPQLAPFVDAAPEQGGCVYFITDGTAVKIGHTGRSVTERLRELQTGNPRLLYVLRTIPSGPALETQFHQEFAARLVREGSEWFALQPHEAWGLDTPPGEGKRGLSTPPTPARLRGKRTQLQQAIELFIQEELENLGPGHRHIMNRDELWSVWSQWCWRTREKPNSKAKFLKTIALFVSVEDERYRVRPQGPHEFGQRGEVMSLWLNRPELHDAPLETLLHAFRALRRPGSSSPMI